MQAPIFYYVNHTSLFPYNSGIQRCVRLLAAALMDAGQPLIPRCLGWPAAVLCRSELSGLGSFGQLERTSS